MAWTPISGTVTQYSTDTNELASGYYIKLYDSGTTTPYSMATDSTGGTLLAKCKLSAEGYPLTNPLDDSTVFIPHINQDYRIVLYRNEADADANTTANAAWNVDGVAQDVAQLADISDISTKGTTLQVQDDYDRSPLYTSEASFTAGAGPHVITVTDDWTPSNADMRFYKLDISGIVVPLTPTVTTSTTFTLAETLLTTDSIFTGDDAFRKLSLSRSGRSVANTNYEFSVFEYYGSANVTQHGTEEPNWITFSDDGLSCWSIGANEYVVVGSLSSAFDLSTWSFSLGRNITGISSSTKSIEWDSDGMHFIAVGSVLQVFTASTPYDVSTLSLASSFSHTVGANCIHSHMSNDGTVIQITDIQGTSAKTITMSTPWDATTSTESLSATTNGADYNGGVANPYGFFSDDGRAYFTIYEADAGATAGAYTLAKVQLDSEYDLTSAAIAGSADTIGPILKAPAWGVGNACRLCPTADRTYLAITTYNSNIIYCYRIKG